MEYLSAWAEQFDEFQKFSWIELLKFPDWNTIKSSIDVMTSKTSFDSAANSSKIFQQFGLIKNFCTDDKLSEWKTNKMSTEKRWVEIFKHLDQHQLPYVEFSHLTEFILCLPGTSAPVERVFATANKIWTEEKSQLSVPKLKAILTVKTNMDYNCCEFFEFVKQQPALLQKISAQEKYEHKQPIQVAVTSPGAMSIDTIPE